MKVTVFEALKHVKDVVEELLEANSEYSDNEQSREYPNEDRLQKYDDRLTVLEEVKESLEAIELDGPAESQLFVWCGRALPKQVAGLIALFELIEEEIQKCVEDYDGMVAVERTSDKRAELRGVRYRLSDACQSIEEARDSLAMYE